MPLPNWSSELQKIIDGELLSLRFLDVKAWNQIGDYMDKVRLRVNAFLAPKDGRVQTLSSLCDSLENLEMEYLNKFSQTEKIEKDGDIIEPRVIRLIAESRKRIGARIQNGSAELSQIEYKRMIWPETKEQKDRESEKGDPKKPSPANGPIKAFRPIDSKMF